MFAAQLPPDEATRLHALYDYSILDTEPEKDYDEITELASYVCNMPIAMISLVDQNRLWFKSRKGLPVGEVNRDFGYCAYAVQQPRKTLVVPGANQTFNFNGTASGEINIGFYAGAPLTTPGGTAIGALCVIDRRPRLLNEEQYNALSTLARNTVSLLEMRRLNRRLDEASQKFEAEMNRRRQLQAQTEERTDNLQRAVENSKTLSGTIPICANCKCVRDEYGQWHEIEAYIQERTEATFTHGICRTCSKKLYPKTHAGLQKDKG